MLNTNVGDKQPNKISHEDLIIATFTGCDKSPGPAKAYNLDKRQNRKPRADSFCL